MSALFKAKMVRLEPTDVMLMAIMISDKQQRITGRRLF